MKKSKIFGLTALGLVGLGGLASIPLGITSCKKKGVEDSPLLNMIKFGEKEGGGSALNTLNWNSSSHTLTISAVYADIYMEPGNQKFQDIGYWTDDAVNLITESPNLTDMGFDYTFDIGETSNLNLRAVPDNQIFLQGTLRKESPANFCIQPRIACARITTPGSVTFNEDFTFKFNSPVNGLFCEDPGFTLHLRLTITDIPTY
jgi:hypothetical protein